MNVHTLSKFDMLVHYLPGNKLCKQGFRGDKTLACYLGYNKPSVTFYSFTDELEALLFKMKNIFSRVKHVHIYDNTTGCRGEIILRIENRKLVHNYTGKEINYTE